MNKKLNREKLLGASTTMLDAKRLIRDAFPTQSITVECRLSEITYPDGRTSGDMVVYRCAIQTPEHIWSTNDNVSLYNLLISVAEFSEGLVDGTAEWPTVASLFR